MSCLIMRPYYYKVFTLNVHTVLDIFALGNEFPTLLGKHFNNSFIQIGIYLAKLPNII